MLAGILIITFSLALLVYWFRYSCILILRNQLAEAKPVAEADSRFSFGQVRERLESATDLDPLEAALDRDYRVLTYLIEHAAALKLGALEDRLLIVDYRIMQSVYRVTRNVAPSHARAALAEMATVLGILVQHIGEQSGAAAEA